VGGGGLAERPGKDAVDLQESASVGIAKGWLDIPELKAVAGHAGAYFGHQDFAFIEREKRHLELYGDSVSEKLSRSGEDLRLVTLHVELEEDAAVGGREHVVEAAEWNAFFVEIS
jgi:hypothetical protein